MKGMMMVRIMLMYQGWLIRWMPLNLAGNASCGGVCVVKEWGMLLCMFMCVCVCVCLCVCAGV